LLEAGINDWGGISPVTKDFINPEAGWPQIAKLREETESRGFTLRERLALYPEYVTRADSVGAAFLSPRVRELVQLLADSEGFAV
jgi:FO synthase